jgi:hypothetical protein
MRKERKVDTLYKTGTWWQHIFVYALLCYNPFGIGGHWTQQDRPSDTDILGPIPTYKDQKEPRLLKKLYFISLICKQRCFDKCNEFVIVQEKVDVG